MNERTNRQRQQPCILMSLLNELEPWHIVKHYATITKHSNHNFIDRLQFPWLTVSIA